MVPSIGSAGPLVTSQLPSGLGRAQATSQETSFSDVFESAVKGVDSLQTKADTQIAALLQGNGNADVGKTMVSVEKADIAFQLMLQVRNKVVSAYQELEKMQF